MYIITNKVTRHSKCYKNREMSKNKTIFGHVHVHANNTCKYYANGNIVYLRTEYRMPGCAAQKTGHPVFVLHENAFHTQPPAMLPSLLLLCVVGPLSGVYGLPWNLPPNFRCTYA